jgi:hypothetical protein
MHRVPQDAQTQRGRLLCILFVRLGKMPAAAGSLINMSIPGDCPTSEED